MKNLKKFLCLMLALLLAFSALAGCGSGSDDEDEADSEAEEETLEITFPLEEEVEYTIATVVAPFAGDLIGEINDFTLFREMEELTNVIFDGTMLSATSASDQINTIIASGDYPDIFPNLDTYSTNGNYQAYEDDVIIDLTDYIETYGPNMTAALDDETRLLLSYQDDDGDELLLNFYLLNKEAMPSNVTGFQYRGDWLDELGLSVPTNLEEFEDVIEAFYVNYGAYVYIGNDPSGVPISTALDIVTSASEFDVLDLPVTLVDGEIQASYMLDEYLTYLTYASEWYEAGYLDPDFLSGSSTADDESGRITTGELGVYSAGISLFSSVNGTFESEGSDAYVVGGSVLLDEDGTTHVAAIKTYSRGSQWCVSSECDNVEILVSWVDYLFSDEGYILFNYGVEGEGLEYDENGDPQLTELVLNNPDGLALISTEYVYCQNEASNIPGVLYMDKNMTGYTDEEMELYQTWKEGVGDSENRIPNGIKLTTDQTETVNNLLGDLTTYADEMISKFVTGNADLSEFDTFREQLELLGINQIIEVYQEAYETYLERLAAVQG